MKITRIPTKEEIKKARLRRVLDSVEKVCHGAAIGCFMIAVLFAVRGVAFYFGGDAFLNEWTIRAIVLAVIGIFFSVM